MRISDNGRGIPTDLHPVTGKSALETVLTVLHAGGKFGGGNSGYKVRFLTGFIVSCLHRSACSILNQSAGDEHFACQVSGGLHGVGISVVNALSEHLEVTVWRQGKAYRQSFRRGLAANELTEESAAPADAQKRGTELRFLFDQRIFSPGYGRLHRVPYCFNMQNVSDNVC